AREHRRPGRVAGLRPVPGRHRAGLHHHRRRRAAGPGLASDRQGHVRQALDHRRHRGRARAAVRRGRPRRSAVPDVDAMKLSWGPEEEAFRAELAAFLDENAPREARGRDFATSNGEEGIPGWARRWQATLFDSGWLVPGYPPELGGRNASTVQTLVYMEEMASRGLPRSLHFPGYAIVAPSLLEFGTDEQKALAPAALRGDTVWCIGMSEPDAGSDLAALSTRAVLDGDQFVVNGQKVWTSYAMWAQKCFLYARTDPAAPKHRGISVLIVDMDTSGIEVRPLRHITGNVDF